MDEKEIRHILIEILYSALNDIDSTTSLKEKLTPETVVSVYRLAKKHDLAHILSNFIYRNKIEIPSQIQAKLQKEDVICVYRYEQMKYAFEEICEVLSDADVEYIPLKGAVLRPYYPLETMRTSCDIDILIREEDLDKAVECLRQKEYRFESKNFHDVSLYSPNNVHLELHFNIQENMDNLDLVLKDAWEYALETDKNKYEFKKEFFAFHIFAHMAYHFISGGCGIRSLMDIWVMERKMGVTYSCAEDLLKKAGIYQFAVQMSKLVQQCFLDNQTDDFSDTVLKYIFDGGMYGSQENHIAVKKSKDKNTVGYVIKRLFLPYKSMTILFPILNKAPILLPFCWVIRWVKTLFSKNARKTISEISVANNINDSKVEEIKKINSRLGL